MFQVSNLNLVDGETGVVTVQGATSVSRVLISGSTAFSIIEPANCSADCIFSPPRSLSQLRIRCDLLGGPIANAILTVIGSMPNDDGSGSLSCQPVPGGTPILDVTPQLVEVTPSPIVGTPSLPYTISIENGGGGAMSVQLRRPAANWVITGCEPDCTVMNGSPRSLQIVFTPTAEGPQNASLEVRTSTGARIDVSLIGAGEGTQLIVLDPGAPAFLMDFGTLALSQQSTRQMRLRLRAPTAVTVGLSSDRPEVTLPASFSATPGDNNFVPITCSSSVPGTFAATITLTAPVAMQTPSTISVRCIVADTRVTISPDRFDFGEVRRSLPPQTQELVATITNPGSVAVPLGDIRIEGGLEGLTVTSPDVTMIGANASIEARITLVAATMGEIDGARLVVEVDGTQLERPIEGEVVSAAAHLEPSSLDLGTVCVGRPVSGTVRLVNDGTARLLMAAPTVEGPFTLTFEPPVTFPAALPVGTTASVEVAPALAAPGVLTGSLVWDVDAEDAPFQVNPIEVEFIADGTAVSPRGLAFGRVEPGTITPLRTITLENCSTQPVELAVQGIAATSGAARAWVVEPETTVTTLDPEERFTLTVGFAPPDPGVYAATLRLDLDGVRQTVDLTGEANGTVAARTSFYACSCASADGGPLGGWPVAIAIAAFARRRRRSAR